MCCHQLHWLLAIFPKLVIHVKSILTSTHAIYCSRTIVKQSTWFISQHQQFISQFVWFSLICITCLYYTLINGRSNNYPVFLIIRISDPPTAFVSELFNIYLHFVYSVKMVQMSWDILSFSICCILNIDYSYVIYFKDDT